MDIIRTPPYEEMQDIYFRLFSLDGFGDNIMNKFALISFICYIQHKMSAKRPDITHYEVIKRVVKNGLPEDVIKGLAVICSDFGHNCEEFPTFNVEDKDIPNKILEITRNWLPF